MPPPVSRPGLAGVRASCVSPVLSLFRLHVTQPYVADLGMSTDPRRGAVKRTWHWVLQAWVSLVLSCILFKILACLLSAPQFRSVDQGAGGGDVPRLSSTCLESGM